MTDDNAAATVASTVKRSRRSEIEIRALDAAAELLRESGVMGCTIEAVSRRCGVGKPSLYRRWPHRTALAIDAFARRIATDAPISDTGDAQRDLTDAFVTIAEQYRGPDGRVFAELLAAAVLEPGAAQMMRERFFLHRREQLLAIWEHGIERGQLDARIDPDDAIDLIFGAGIFRLLLGDTPVTAAHARRLAHTALGAVTYHRPTHPT